MSNKCGFLRTQDAVVALQRTASEPHRHHEAVEQCCELRVGIKRQDLGDVLSRAYDDDAAPVTIDAAPIEKSLASRSLKDRGGRA
jgi:hypothetical protein